MLLGVGIQAPEDIRGGGFLEFDRRDETQDLVPLDDDQISGTLRTFVGN